MNSENSINEIKEKDELIENILIELSEAYDAISELKNEAKALVTDVKDLIRLIKR